MALLGIDIGGTKLAAAVFTDDGEILSREVILLGDLSEKDPGSMVTETAGKPTNDAVGKTTTETVEKPVADKVGKLIADTVRKFLNQVQPDGSRIRSIGISVPGIYRIKEGTVWAPNIPGWDNYPLLQELEAVCASLSLAGIREGGLRGTVPVTGDKAGIDSAPIPVTIDSDRACYILGEMWKGNARGCRNAIFLAVGTGIGAGILADGRILRGANDIAGAIGWMALNKPFRDEYISCGCFEHHASGEGIAKVAREYLNEDKEYTGNLRERRAEENPSDPGFPGTLSEIPAREITSHDVFEACRNEDPLALKVIKESTEYWGMAIANLISLFNPEKIILGGGVFGPAVNLIPEIVKEAARWAQPISSSLVRIETSSLGADAGVYGAGWLAGEKIGSVSIIVHPEGSTDSGINLDH